MLSENLGCPNTSVKYVIIPNKTSNPLSALTPLLTKFHSSVTYLYNKQHLWVGVRKIKFFSLIMRISTK